MLAVGIHEEDVADGIDFTDERALQMLAKRFAHTRTDHLKAKVIGRPANEATAQAQGYPSVEDYLKARGGQ